MIERLAASRCPVCGLVAAPPARWCPRHPVEMARASVAGAGEVISFTTLHSPPAGFRSPLHIALVELAGGAPVICHRAGTPRLRVGSLVVNQAPGDVFLFSLLSARLLVGLLL